MKKLTSTQTGNRAEQAASEALTRLGYTIIDKNWRMPDCEIDIVAKKQAVFVFFEVKYRQNHSQGGGLEYITDTKLTRMRYGARRYMTQMNIDTEYDLGAVEVVGNDYAVAEVIESISL